MYYAKHFPCIAISHLLFFRGSNFVFLAHIQSSYGIELLSHYVTRRMFTRHGP